MAIDKIVFDDLKKMAPHFDNACQDPALSARFSLEKKTVRFVLNSKVVFQANFIRENNVCISSDYFYGHFNISLDDLPEVVDFLNKHPFDPTFDEVVSKSFVPTIFYAILENEQRIKRQKKAIKTFLKTNDDFFRKIHRNRELNFTAMPVSQFNEKHHTNVLLYKSMSHNRKQSSEYRLMIINGAWAYARKSNHWGNFSTVSYASTTEEYEAADNYGRLGSKCYFWNLVGGDNDKNNSQAGYIFLSDLGLDVCPEEVLNQP